MKKWLVVLFVFCLMSFTVVFAAGDQTGSTSQVTSSSSTGATGDTGTSAQSSSSSGDMGIDIHPIDPQAAAAGFRKAGQDMGVVASGARVPMMVYGICAAGVVFLIGIFNKKFIGYGIGMIAIVLFISWSMGDIPATVTFFGNVGATLRHYWQ